MKLSLWSVKAAHAAATPSIFPIFQMVRPLSWRVWEYTPSYAGTSTRMDFLLPQHNLVIETKRVRDKSHGRKLGDELIIDIEHYRKHPGCNSLWCVIYDPDKYMENPTGFATDLEGERNTQDGSVLVSVFYFS